MFGRGRMGGRQNDLLEREVTVSSADLKLQIDSLKKQIAKEENPDKALLSLILLSPDLQIAKLQKKLKTTQVLSSPLLT